jgi:hypothetical protein
VPVLRRHPPRDGAAARRHAAAAITPLDRQTPDQRRASGTLPSALRALSAAPEQSLAASTPYPLPIDLVRRQGSWLVLAAGDDT